MPGACKSVEDLPSCIVHPPCLAQGKVVLSWVQRVMSPKQWSSTTRSRSPVRSRGLRSGKSKQKQRQAFIRGEALRRGIPEEEVPVHRHFGDRARPLFTWESEPDPEETEEAIPEETRTEQIFVCNLQERRLSRVTSEVRRLAPQSSLYRLPPSSLRRVARGLSSAPWRRRETPEGSIPAWNELAVGEGALSELRPLPPPPGPPPVTPPSSPPRIRPSQRSVVQSLRSSSAAFVNPYVEDREQEPPSSHRENPYLSAASAPLRDPPVRGGRSGHLNQARGSEESVRVAKARAIVSEPTHRHPRVERPSSSRGDEYVTFGGRVCFSLPEEFEFFFGPTTSDTGYVLLRAERGEFLLKCRRVVALDHHQVLDIDRSVSPPIRVGESGVLPQALLLDIFNICV